MKETYKTRLLYVNAYLVTRQYGGPEEGGWWYDTGTPLASVPVLLTEPYTIEYEVDEYGDAADNRAIIDHWVDTSKLVARDKTRIDRFEKYHTQTLAEYDDGRDLGSVLSTGRVDVMVELNIARSWPEVRPHYE